MDLFLASCQGLGLALAAGMLAGVPGGLAPSAGTAARWAPAIAAALVGAVLFGVSLSAAEHPAWPGAVAGAAVGWLSAALWRGVIASASARQGAGTAVGVPVAIAAAVLAGLSLLIEPVSLVAAASFVWLAAGRWRRTGRKYEGLRILR